MCFIILLYASVPLIMTALFAAPIYGIWGTINGFSGGDGKKSGRDIVLTAVLGFAVIVQGLIIIYSIGSGGYTYEGAYSYTLGWIVLAAVFLLMPLPMLILPLYGLIWLLSGTSAAKFIRRTAGPSSGSEAQGEKRPEASAGAAAFLILCGIGFSILLVVGIVVWQLGIFNLNQGSTTSTGSMDNTLMAQRAAGPGWGVPSLTKAVASEAMRERD